MDNVCDFCGQARAGVIFMGRNEKGEREERRICFDCIAKYVEVGEAEAEEDAEGEEKIPENEKED